MSGIKFFQSIMGKQFYDGTMPALVRVLRELVEELRLHRMGDADMEGDGSEKWQPLNEAVLTKPCQHTEIRCMIGGELWCSHCGAISKDGSRWENPVRPLRVAGPTQ